MIGAFVLYREKEKEELGGRDGCCGVLTRARFVDVIGARCWE